MIGRAARLLAAVAMVAMAVTVAAPPAGAQSPASISQLRLADQTTWVTDGGLFRLAVSVSTPDPAGAKLQMTIYRALSTRSDFADSVVDKIHTTRLQTFDPVPLSSLGASPELSVTVNPKAKTVQSVRLLASGVYPVKLELFDATGTALTRLTTHLVYSGADAATATRLDVGLVVPFRAAPKAGDTTGLLNVSGQLAIHPKVALTLTATPETVESAAGGSQAERMMVSQLAEAFSLGNRELPASPYARLDLPAMLGAGLDAEIATQLASGSAVLAANLHAVPTSATWIEYGPLSGSAVDDLVARGVRRLVVADKSLTPLPPEDRGRTLVQPFEVMGKTSRLAGAPVDAGLNAHFVDKGDVLLAAHQLLADLAFVQLESPNKRGGRGVVVVPPLGWQPDASFLATVLDGLAASPTLTPVTVDRLFTDVTPLPAGQNPLVRGVAAGDQQPRGQAISDAVAIRGVRRLVASLSAVVPASTAAIDEIERDILISESADLSDRSRPAQLAAATSLIDHLKGMVRLPGNQSITFTARQGLIPVTILSSAPYPVRVKIRFSSQKLGFQPLGLPGGGCTQAGTSEVCTIDLKAQNTTVRVPVEAKTAGVFSLTVALDSPDGALNLATNQDTVRSTAASGVGIFLSLGAVLLLAVWWVRDVLHGRRARRLMPKRFDLGFGELAFAGGGLATEPGDREAGDREPGDREAGDREAGDREAGDREPAPTPSALLAPALPVPSARAAATATAVVARPRLASWDDQSGMETQPVPIVPSDLSSQTPQPQDPPKETNTADSFSRNTALMATGTLLSRLTGFGRVLALVWAFGITSGVTDVYTIANTAPNILYDLVLGGILSATLVPVFVDYLSRDDPDEGWRAISAVVTAITVVLAALCAVFWLATPAIIGFYSLLNNTAGAADERAIGTTLLHMFVPQLFLLGGIAVTTALLNARRTFALPAFSPVVNNLVVIGAIVAARMVATSVTLPGIRADTSALLILGLGTTSGYLFQFLVQVPPMMRAGFRLRPVWDLSHPAVRTVLRLSLWTFGSVMANQVSFNLIMVLAEHRKGDVAVFTTAYQFFQLPYAIFAVSIASVITPDLAEHWAKRDLEGFRRQMANGLRLTMAVLVPAAVGYVVLAHPFLNLVFRHGSFTAGDAQRIGTVVALFAVGLPGFSAYLLLMRAYQAMQDTRSMFWLYLVENAATLVLAGALYPVMGVNGLALGWVGAYSVGSIAAFAHLRRRTGSLDGRVIVAGLVRVAAATLVMVVPVLALIRLVPGHSTPILAVQVIGGALAGGIVYLVAAQLFGISELTTLLRRRRLL